MPPANEDDIVLHVALAARCHLLPTTPKVLEEKAFIHTNKIEYNWDQKCN